MLEVELAGCLVGWVVNGFTEGVGCDLRNPEFFGQFLDSREKQRPNATPMPVAVNSQPTNVQPAVRDIGCDETGQRAISHRDKATLMLQIDGDGVLAGDGIEPLRQLAHDPGNGREVLFLDLPDGDSHSDGPEYLADFRCIRDRCFNAA